MANRNEKRNGCGENFGWRVISLSCVSKVRCAKRLDFCDAFFFNEILIYGSFGVMFRLFCNELLQNRIHFNLLL